jgi:long-chain acyl-CoA synthetase
MHPHFFLTGGTGLIGTSLVPRLLRAFPSCSLSLLVRADTPEAAQERVRDIARQAEVEWAIHDASERIMALHGDITLENFGLSAQQTRQLVRATTHIIHGAATIRFDHPIGQARRINCDGTHRMLDFAERCVQQGPLDRFAYLGTSSVSGRSAGLILEDDLETGQLFFNTYEQSKAESERLVRTRMDRLPVTIFRPSIVIGDSTTGRTTTFNVIYLPLRLIERGILHLLPGPPETTLDVVPVDWVNDAMIHILGCRESLGKVFHITAGPRRVARLGDLVQLAAEYFDRTVPLARPRAFEFVTPEEYGRRLVSMPAREQELLLQLQRLLPYIGIDRLFDTTNADALLQGSGIRFPPFAEYAEKIFEYCIRTAWGKRAA